MSGGGGTSWLPSSWKLASALFSSSSAASSACAWVQCHQLIGGEIMLQPGHHKTLHFDKTYLHQMTGNMGEQIGERPADRCQVQEVDASHTFLASISVVAALAALASTSLAS